MYSNGDKMVVKMPMKPITVSEIKLHPVALPLVEKLQTSSSWNAPGSNANRGALKSAIIIELHTSDGVVGWGECPAKLYPSYAYEDMGTALHVTNEFLVDAVIGQTIQTPTGVPGLLKGTRGHPMAKAGVEAAVWDAMAKANDMPLADLFAAHLPAGHASRGYADVGVSIGIQDSIDETLAIIQKRLDQGYGRIKLKIRPGWDVELATRVREVYPDISLMLDANSAYTLDDVDTLKQLDTLDLLMIEQPLAYNDIYEHGKLQPQLNTRVCLDESIKTVGDTMLAVETGAAKIINLKPARVSGYTESLKIYQYCVDHDVPLWIGGLLETGVGRAANLAFASLPGVTLPCDISATDRYFDPDLTDPPFVLSEGSVINVPDAPGIGVDVVPERLETAAICWLENIPYKSAEKPDYVYFFHDTRENVVKIGHSRDVPKRLKTLSKEYGKPLTVLGIQRGDKYLKMRLQKQFADAATGDEWFSYTDAVRDYITINTAQLPEDS